MNILLTVAIPSLRARQNLLWRALSALELQADPRLEVLVEVDNGELTIGEKRNLLLGKANGLFIAGLDEDDLTEPDYVQTIFRAIETTPEADCVELIANVYRTIGDVTKERSMRCSLDYDRESQDIDPVRNCKRYLRPPCQISPVRTSILKKAGGYPNVSINEEILLWERLRPHLRTEAKTNKALYNYFSIANRVRKEVI